MKTILLDRTTWDLVLDTSGNIAAASNPYALAQDAASAIRTVQGEQWYNSSLGAPLFSILGKTPNVSYMKAKFVAAALTVPEVVAAQCFITSIANRRVAGQVQVTDRDGVITAANF